MGRLVGPTFLIVVGWVMIVLGAFVAIHPLLPGVKPITGQIWLDVAFAVFFLVRGWMNVRAGRRVRAARATQQEPGNELP